METLMILTGILLGLKGIQLIWKSHKERKRIEAEIYELEQQTGVDLYD